jgi:type IV secretion system protein TrbL
VVTRRQSVVVGLGIVSAVLLITTPAHAQSAGVLDEIVGQFQSRAAGWEGSLRSFALNTFGILAATELAWAAIRLAFRGADVSEWLAEIVNQILFLGFFLALLETPSRGARRSSTASGRRRAQREAVVSLRAMYSPPVWTSHKR